MTPPVDEESAARDLAFVQDLLARTRRRIDAHAYQFIWWGAVVLVWYPLGNLLPEAWGAVMAVCLGIGVIGSVALGWWNGRRPRIAAESTVVSRQIGEVVFACIGGGVVLSVVGPGSGFVDGQHVPTVWALVYAIMTYLVGILYAPEWRWSGVVILVAAVVSMFLPQWSGLIVGPPMGLGLIIPGILAERRIRRFRAEDRAAAAGHGADPDGHGGRGEPADARSASA